MTNKSSSRAYSAFGADRMPLLNGIEELFKYNEINCSLGVRGAGSHRANRFKGCPGSVNSARSLLVTFDTLARGGLAGQFGLPHSAQQHLELPEVLDPEFSRPFALNIQQYAVDS